MLQANSLSQSSKGSLENAAKGVLANVDNHFQMEMIVNIESVSN